MKVKDYFNERKSNRKFRDEESEWGVSSDGWNERELEETGLMDVLDDVARLSYELKNARRGSYARFGDTVSDLASHVRNIARDLKNVARDLKDR